jgi:predicted RND superfamily exporter protein
VRLLLKIYPLILIAGLALTLISWPRMGYLFKHISTDPVDLLPKDYQSVQTLLEIRDKVSQNNNFGIVLESEHPENTKAALHALKPLIEKSPLVGKVSLTKPGYEFLDKNKFLFMDTALQTLRSHEKNPWIYFF